MADTHNVCVCSSEITIQQQAPLPNTYKPPQQPSPSEITLPHHHYLCKRIYKATYKIYELIYSSKLKLKYSSIQWLIKMLKISCEVHDKKFKRSN